ncbi:unnamed protein product [Cylindrotheca closterium]|uniref:Uncharacterized protein n=1 Tax=Cylindrotheca closterium TaxID=2856 RepID=A0AAD2G2Y6_9STRA|nr:unnamed protein product [Cylindrotheca closterium]
MPAHPEQRNQEQEQQEQEQQEQDEQQEQMPARPEQRNQVHDQARQGVQQDGHQVQNFLEFTPRQQHTWLRAQCDWWFVVADHFQPMTYTTVEIAISMLCDYMMYSGRLHELPMDHGLPMGNNSTLPTSWESIIWHLKSFEDAATTKTMEERYIFICYCLPVTSTEG